MNSAFLSAQLTAKVQRPLTSYRGRFAPSPSGFLHFGSLIAALASYLDAKSHQGAWLVRIEDVDPPREKEGASSHILKTLEAYGLHWDENVLYQSQQTSLYLDVLQQLADKNLSYNCRCTRAEIKKLGGIYQGHCRELSHARKNSAVRLLNLNGISQYSDLVQGKVVCDNKLAQEDFTLVRKDGLFAYQLAVVIDDCYQGISHIIRGCDLLEPTARQLSFFKLLGLPAPQYGHVPLAVTHEGFKLSKQNGAPVIDIANPKPSLIAALDFLGQQPPQQLFDASVDEIIHWSIKHWCLDNVPKTQSINISTRSIEKI